MDSEIFYRNVFILIQASPPTKDFLKHFREGMFDKPNTIGFQHATHYLLTIYDAERFKRQVQWPLFCKKTEAKYRSDVKDFITLVAQENPDVDFPQILASHLLHASGSKFNNIMSNLSTVALRTWIKRETDTMLYVPKIGFAQDIAERMFKRLADENMEVVEKMQKKMTEDETKAKEFAKEIAESIKKSQDELFQTRQNWMELASDAPVHPDMKKRLNDSNDAEVLRMWKSSCEDTLKYIKKKENRLREIAECSENVASMVKSIVSNDTNILDGQKLPKINTKLLSEMDELSPETQVQVYRLYEKDNLILENFLSLLNYFITDLRCFIEKNGFPDVSECEGQVSASLEDIRSINNIFHSLHDNIMELTSQIKNKDDGEDREFNYTTSCNIDHDLFDSVILKSSPTININLNMESDGHELRERLELTPVENVHRALFSRHERKEEATNQNFKLRPKLFVSRINFDETRPFSMSEKFSPVRNAMSSRKIDEWNASKNGIYSRIFSSYNKRVVGRLNYSVRSTGSSSRINSLTDMNSTCDVYNATELQSHLAVKNKYTGSQEIYSPKKFTPTKENGKNRASSTIIEDDKSLEVSVNLSIGKKKDMKLQAGISPKIMEKPQNRRLSISDLVERYKKICDNSVDVTARMNFSSENSDESENN